MSAWRKRSLDSFQRAPSMEMLKQGNLSDSVVQSIEAVRKQAYRRGSAAPFLSPCDLNYERVALDAKTLSRQLYTHGKTFMSKSMQSQSADRRMEAWLKQRPHVVNLMLGSLQSRSDCRLVASQFLEELTIARSAGDALVQTIALVCSEIDCYAALCFSVILYHCDLIYSPEFTAMSALESLKRTSQMDLISFFSHLELLLLQTRGAEAKPRSYLYNELALQDPTVVMLLHKHAVRGIREGEGRFREEVATELDIACCSARSLARSLPESQRAGVWQLSSLAYQYNIVGIDEMYGRMGEGETKMAPREGRNRHRERTVALARSVPEKDPEIEELRRGGSVVAAVQTGLGQQHSLQRLNTAPPPPRTSPHGQPPESKYRVNWRAVEAAAANPSDKQGYKLAAMMFPSSQDVSKYDHKRAAEGFPKPTVVKLDEHGKPMLRSDGSVYTTYNRGLPGSPDCRRCGIYVPAKGLSQAGWLPREISAAHNPRFCLHSIRALLAEGAAGAAMLWEINKDQRK